MLKPDCLTWGHTVHPNFLWSQWGATCMWPGTVMEDQQTWCFSCWTNLMKAWEQTYLYFSIAFNVVSLGKKFTRITLKTVSTIFPADGTPFNFFVLGGVMASAAARISVQNGRPSFITPDSVWYEAHTSCMLIVPHINYKYSLCFFVCYTHTHTLLSLNLHFLFHVVLVSL